MRIIEPDSVKEISDATPAAPIYHSSGYTLNMPLGLQGPPGWTNDFPDLVAELQAARTSLGIVVEDDRLSYEPSTSDADRPGFWDILTEKEQ